ncbi:MAG: hypothetical protein ACK5Q5_04585 [Planctomycetaceae bacterium]
MARKTGASRRTAPSSKPLPNPLPLIDVPTLDGGTIQVPGYRDGRGAWLPFQSVHDAYRLSVPTIYRGAEFRGQVIVESMLSTVATRGKGEFIRQREMFFVPDIVRYLTTRLAPPDWIPLPEAARIVGVAPEKIERLFRKGLAESRTFMGRSLQGAYRMMNHVRLDEVKCCLRSPASQPTKRSRRFHAPAGWMTISDCADESGFGSTTWRKWIRPKRSGGTGCPQLNGAIIRFREMKLSNGEHARRVWVIARSDFDAVMNATAAKQKSGTELSSADLAKRFRCSRGAVWHRLAKHGIKPIREAKVTGSTLPVPVYALADVQVAFADDRPAANETFIAEFAREHRMARAMVRKRMEEFAPTALRRIASGNWVRCRVGLREAFEAAALRREPWPAAETGSQSAPVVMLTPRQTEVRQPTAMESTDAPGRAAAEHDAGHDVSADARSEDSTSIIAKPQRGRPRKWDRLCEVIAEFPNLSNAAIAGRYNQRFSTPIAAREMSKADAARVRMVKADLRRK